MAILNLLYTYARLVDAGDFSGVSRLLGSAEVTAEGMSRAISGKAAVLALYESTTRRYSDNTPRTRHLITNPVIDIDEVQGRAAVYSTYTVMQAVAPTELRAIICGNYDDEFERAHGVWRFAKRHISVALTGDLSGHLLFDL